MCYVGDGEVMNPEQVIPPSAGMPRPMLNSAAIQWQFYATFTTTETRAPSRTRRARALLRRSRVARDEE